MLPFEMSVTDLTQLLHIYVRFQKHFQKVFVISASYRLFLVKTKPSYPTPMLWDME